MISGGGEYLTSSSLVLSLSLLLLFAGFFLNIVAGVSTAYYSNGVLEALSTQPGAGAVPADT